MKLLLIFFTFFSLYTTIIAQEEIRTPKYTLGYNVIPLLGNSNEFIIERSISKKFNAFINLGNTFGPTRGGIKIDDGLELEKMSGLFLKLGGRYHIYKDPSNNFSIGLAIIGSRYQESGIDESYSINLDTTFNREVSAEGFLVGLGTDFKYDTKIYKFIYLRIGSNLDFLNAIII